MLGRAARENKVTVVIGANEKVEKGIGNGTLYNALLTFDETGKLANHHRKLIPTYTERPRFAGALDKLSASLLNDLERTADLLGERGLRSQNRRLRIVSLFPGVVLRNARHSVSPRRRLATAFPFDVVFPS